MPVDPVMIKWARTTLFGFISFFLMFFPKPAPGNQNPISDLLNIGFGPFDVAFGLGLLGVISVIVMIYKRRAI